MAFKRLSDEQLVELVEAAIFVSDKPLSKRRLQETVLQDFNISAKRLNQPSKL
jgi:segregation and condensation protein B